MHDGMIRRIICLLLPLLLLPAPALAWGGFAHRLTASIAEAQLSPAARREIRSLLRVAPALDTPGCPLATLQDASVWPDCVRALPDGRFGFSAPWHYQNISVCAPFDINVQCPNGDCVTAQIPRQQAILADRSRSPGERLQALAFLVHLVGDLHQPLHVGDKSDLGGNRVSADYGFKTYDRMNLHRIWDGEMAERALTEPPAITPRSITPAQRRACIAGPSDTAAKVALWAHEAWDISRRIAYPQLQDYPDTCPIPPAARPRDARGRVTPAYIGIAAPPPAIRWPKPAPASPCS